MGLIKIKSLDEVKHGDLPLKTFKTPIDSC